jgi:DNA-directed RNA polymerase specialized sigma24 family protein
VNLMPPDGNREPMDDDELIAAMADGDDAALRELFTRHAPWLAARLRAMLPAADVEDVLQESFLAVWRGAHRYRPEGSPGGWLWGITRRQAALWLRRRGPDGVPLTVLEAGAREHFAGQLQLMFAHAFVGAGSAPGSGAQQAVQAALLSGPASRSPRSPW